MTQHFCHISIKISARNLEKSLRSSEIVAPQKHFHWCFQINSFVTTPGWPLFFLIMNCQSFLNIQNSLPSLIILKVVTGCQLFCDFFAKKISNYRVHFVAGRILDFSTFRTTIFTKLRWCTTEHGSYQYTNGIITSTPLCAKRKQKLPPR